jgi:choline dehydrogenase
MSYDYVIAGGGSAGCVLANRLSADGTKRVLLLEAGQADRHPYIHVPGLTMKALALPGIMWDYQGAPDPSRNDAVSLWMAGRVLGGGSSVNGLVWVRGHRADYDRWAELGCEGWDWHGVEPYFRRSERYEPRSPLRGCDGPVRVERVRAQHVITDAFVAAASAAGHRYTEDYNGERQEGAAYGQTNVSHGLRQSTARVYLGRARQRRNLRVVTGAFVERILFDGTRAVGAVYRRGGQLSQVEAQREVILSAGAIASPKILMLSGVGSADHLGQHGIPVIADLPGVGRNLQEHAVTGLLWNVDVRTFGMDFTPRGFAQHGLEWLMGRGPAAAGIMHATVFSKIHPDSPRTEVEIAFAPVAVVGGDAGDTTGETLSGSGTHDVTSMQLLNRATVTTYVNLLHPRTRGSIELRSAHPVDNPVIRHQMLGDDQDLRDLVAACRQLREIFDTSPLREHVVSEALPGPGVKTDEEWETYLRSSATYGSQHPTCTCRMGIDEQAVVDPHLRVRGVTGLRVVDASVMPEVTSGNTNAPTIMIAEKAADLIAASGEQ